MRRWLKGSVGRPLKRVLVVREWLEDSARRRLGNALLCTLCLVPEQYYYYTLSTPFCTVFASVSFRPNTTHHKPGRSLTRLSLPARRVYSFLTTEHTTFILLFYSILRSLVDVPPSSFFTRSLRCSHHVLTLLYIHVFLSISFFRSVIVSRRIILLL